jgi:hypothetical protein
MAAQKWRTEDWVAVYLGFFIIAAILAAFSWKLFDFGSLRSTFRWTTDAQIAARAPDWSASLDQVAKDAEGGGRKDLAAAANAVKAALQANDRPAIEKSAGALAKAGGRNTVPGSLGSEIRGHAAAQAGKVFSGANLAKGVTVGIAALIIGAVGFALIGGKVGAFLLAFPVVFVLAWLARMLAGNGLFVEYGVE